MRRWRAPKRVRRSLRRTEPRHKHVGNFAWRLTRVQNGLEAIDTLRNAFKGIESVAVSYFPTSESVL